MIILNFPFYDINFEPKFICSPKMKKPKAATPHTGTKATKDLKDKKTSFQRTNTIHVDSSAYSKDLRKGSY